MNQLQVTRCRHEALGQEAEIPTEAVPAYQARGWEPVTESRTLEAIQTDAYMADVQGQLAVVEAQELADEVTHLTVAQVLDEVGDDPEKASAALEVEAATEKPRKSLVAALQKLVEAATEPPPDPDAGSGDGGNTDAGSPGETDEGK